MNTEFKGTPAPWYPINYAGYINLQSEPYYETNSNLLNEDYFGEKAVYNAQLAATAPELLSALHTLIEKCLQKVNTNYIREELYNAQQVIQKALNPDTK